MDLSGPEKRAERFAQLALWRDSAVFGVSGAAVFVGLIAMRRIPETRAARTHRLPARLRWWRNPGILVPCLAVGALGTVFSM